MTRKRWFWGAVLLQLLAIFGMVAIHGYTLATGAPVLLKTVPVDPWDLFRGEYVTLRYEISTVDAGKVAMQGLPYRRGQQVYVTLRQGDPYWTVGSVSAARTAAGDGEMVVKARVEWDSGREVGLRYGIEQFYVPEGEGKDLELQVENMAVEALVDRFGRSALHRVFVDGKEIDWR